MMFIQGCEELQVFPSCQLFIEAGKLEIDTYPFIQVPVEPFQLNPTNLDFSIEVSQQPGENLLDGCLPCSGRAEESEYFPSGTVKVDVCNKRWGV